MNDKTASNGKKCGYLPNVDDTLKTKKMESVFDYAALMTAMLRSSGISDAP